MEQFARTEALIGRENLSKLINARVIVFGIGGVGGYTVEALARCGVGHLDLVDNDVVNITNLNRQIIATNKSLNKYKTEVMKERISDINPNAVVNTYNVFYTKENADLFDFSKYDYIVDAIDTVSAKIELVLQADKTGTPVISSMGTGNKLHPELFEVTDIYKTSVCPLARVIRQELKKQGIKKLKVVYSKEIPIKNSENKFPSSISFVPSVAGLILASAVVNDIIDND